MASGTSLRAQGPTVSAARRGGSEEHEGDQPQLGIAGGAAPAGPGAPERGGVLGGVGDAQRRPVDREDGQPAPAGPLGRGRAPHGGGLGEQGREGLGPQALAGLHDRTAGHSRVAACAGQHEVEMAHHLADRAIAEQRHSDDEPHDEMRRQFPSADRRAIGRVQRRIDPRGIQGFTEDLEARRAVARTHGEQGRTQLHPPPPPPPRRSIDDVTEKPVWTAGYRLSDRHWDYPPNRLHNQ